jgi:hypothetical protein
MDHEAPHPVPDTPMGCLSDEQEATSSRQRSVQSGEATGNSFYGSGPDRRGRHRSPRSPPPEVARAVPQAREASRLQASAGGSGGTTSISERSPVAAWCVLRHELRPRPGSGRRTGAGGVLQDLVIGQTLRGERRRHDRAAQPYVRHDAAQHPDQRADRFLVGRDTSRLAGLSAPASIFERVTGSSSSRLTSTQCCVKYRVRFPQSMFVRAMCSASMIVVTFGAVDGTRGMIEASTTRRRLTPRTLPTLSTTAHGSFSPPMGAVEVGCW